MPKTAYLANHLSSEKLKNKYRTSQDPVETRRWHLLWKISLGWTIKNAAIAVGLDYQYAFKILKKYNELSAYAKLITYSLPNSSRTFLM
jgi:molybdenum-dependent DNA-binding transcriptional regulator ModE